MAIPQELMNPPLMVIGDSLAQGCRSLTVNRDFCAQSWGVRVAESQNWKFVTPDYPRPILFDLEQEVRQLGDLVQIAPSSITFGGFITRLMQNLRAWLANRKESAFICFDNLGLSGAKISDLYARTAATSNAEILKLFPNGAAGPIHLTPDEIGGLHLAINGRFTLNPSQDPQYENFTPLDWVRARQPKILAVQIGHNHGLYSIGGDAVDKPFDGPEDDGTTFIASLTKLATELGQLPPSIEKIVYLFLPKVGAVANLKPQSTVRNNGYADGYDPVLSTSTSSLSGDVLRTIDIAINAFNQQQIKQVITQQDPHQRTLYFDAFSMFNGIDYKNSLNSAERIPIDATHSIDNWYITGRLVLQPPWPPGTPPIRKDLARGGFQNIDGMHPSGCGYAYLASKVVDLLQLQCNPAALLEEAFKQDALLNDFPMKLNLLVSALDGILTMMRDAGQVFQPTGVISELQTDLHLLDAINLMHNAVLH